MNDQMPAAPGRIIGYGKRGPIRLAAGGDETETQDRFVLSSLEDLRGRTPDELVQICEVMEAHLRDMHQNDKGEIRELDDVQRKAFDLGMKIRTRAMDMLTEHRAIAEQFAKRPESVKKVYANLKHGLDDGTADVVRMPVAEARDKALKVLDGRDVPLADDQKTQVEKYIRRDTGMARRLLITENDAYRSAWMKMVTDPNALAMLDEDERLALRAWGEYRAASENVTTAGGFGIPIKLVA